MTSNPVFRLGMTWQCPADQNAYIIIIIYHLFWMSHFGWLNEFGPYISINPTALPLHPCESHAMLSTMVDTGVFAGLVRWITSSKVKKDSDLFNTVTQCAPVGKTGFIESYSHIGRTSWQVFVCSGGEVECMLAASIHNIKSIHCSHPVPLGAWTWKRGCQAMHLTENASPSQRNVKIRCPLPWRSAATWFDMLSYSWCSVFCLTPLANQISC